MQKGLSVINHLLIYLIKQGPAACRHLSLVVGECGGGGGGCQVYSAPPLHWVAAGGAHLRMKGWREGGKGGKEWAGGGKRTQQLSGVQTQRQRKK